MSENNKSDRAARPPNARLCHVIKNDNFEGYGFNLHADKGKQYIGKVDEGSPAEVAGLRQGDHILEVNGVSILEENHKQVVQRIKARPAETELLVVHPDDEVTNNSNELTGNGHQADHHDNNTSSAVHQQNNNTGASLNLSMTAAELRAKLAAKKKFDPRKETIDFKKKFDVVQKL